MSVVDFHNHFYPPEYLSGIQDGPSNIKVTFDGDKNPLLHYPGDYNIVVPGHRDIDFREAVLKKSGIDMQVLTFTSPGTHVETSKRAVELAISVNDAFARIKAERPERFTAMATLPLCDPKASLHEFERAISGLGFRGIMLFSNVNGVPLSDKRFWPIYEAANDHETVLYIHPIHPVGVEAMMDYWLMPLLGFTFDTTLAAAKLVFSGVVERFPKIRWVLAHLGGTIPYLAERLDRGYLAFKECQKNISKPPGDYLKTFYYDSVNFDPKALRLAVDFTGADHILAGSDYPHKIGSLSKMLESIDALGLCLEEKNAILGGTTRMLLGLSENGHQTN